MQLLTQILLNGFAAGCILGVSALGFGLIYTTTRVFHVAHGAVIVASAYLLYALVAKVSIPVIPAATVVVFFASLMGVVIGEAYHPLDSHDPSRLRHLLASLGVYIVTSELCAAIWGHGRLLMPVQGMRSTIVLADLVLSASQILAILIFALLFGGYLFFLRRTRWGVRLRAYRDDPEMLTAIGMNPRHMRWLIFGLGSAMAGLGAVLLTLDTGIVPSMGLHVTISAAVAVIIGGASVLEGAAAGALLVGVAQGVAVWKIGSSWQEAVLFLLLVACLTVRPKGLLAHRGRAEEVRS